MELQDIKVKLEFFKYSIKSTLGSYLFGVGLFLTLTYYFLSVWSYKVEENIVVTTKTIGLSQGYGNSSYRVYGEYLKGNNKVDILIDLPPGVAVQKGDKLTVNRHYRYLLPDNYTFVSK